MSEGAQGILILAVVTVGTAVLWHVYLKRYLLASVAAALTASALFQVIIYIQLGYVDPFLPIAVLFSTPACFVLSLVVGLPFRRRRAKKGSDGSIGP